MQELDRLFKSAKKCYDADNNPLDVLLKITTYCLNKLSSEATSRLQGKIGPKEYLVYEAADCLSRPCLASLFIPSSTDFTQKWDILLSSIKPEIHKIDSTPSEVDAVLYTSSMAFSMCYDIWKPKSRKTPGTYLEVLLGSIMARTLPDYQRTKHIPLPIDEASENEAVDSVSTDIVFEKSNEEGEIFGLVIPAKITTRERIVQPFAHQRILDSVFGPDRFNSILICISEMQLDKIKNKVNEICVPGTIRLFQAHLAKLNGIYYLDPPIRYLQEDVTAIIPVGSVGELLTNKLPELI